jgi:Mn2+/Fe2+ NRAMP family transporter
MFAAGFTSAITSPLASSLTARSIFEKKNTDGTSKNGHIFKWISYAVLLIGVTLGFLQIKPVPAIVAAQAFNGLILPFVAVFLFMVVNNAKIMGAAHLNGWFSNLCMVIVTWVTLVLGIVNVTKAVTSTLEDVTISPDLMFGAAAILAFVITVIISIHIFAKRRRELQKIEQLK